MAISGRLVIWTLTAVGSALVVAAQIPPDDATTNLAAWFAFLGDRIPAWTQGPYVDVSTTIVGAWLLWGAVFLLWRRRGRATIESGAAALSEVGPIPADALEWLAPEHAIEQFCDPSLVSEKNKWGEKYEKAAIDEVTIGEKIKFPKGSPQYDHQYNMRMKLSKTNQDYSLEALGRAWTALRKNIAQKLEKEELIAKGMVSPYAPGAAEKVIPAHEWRVLEIDPLKMQAVQGGEVKYIGVVIGKKDA